MASRLYGAEPVIRERHRHRYEVNNDYLKTLEKNGLRVAGLWAEKQLVEIIEIEDHPYFVAGQFTRSSGRGRGIRTRSSPAS